MVRFNTRRDLASSQQAAFDAFGNAVSTDGTLSAKIKQIIAVAVAYVTQCPYCTKEHTKAGLGRARRRRN